MTTPRFDLRLLAVRSDLADAALRDLFIAPRYAEPRAATCCELHVPVRVSPRGERSSELLEGEQFMVLDVDGSWAWGWCAHDHYVGYIEAGALGDVPLAHEQPAGDPVEAALRFLDMPYLLGGRGGAGIDCSALVQRAFAAVGTALPRDSDMQKELGVTVGPEALTRGDLVGFAGHIGIMLDPETLLHATAYWGRVVVEPLASVAERSPIETRRRIPSAEQGLQR